jgi:phospholipid/cholesterol/gamma-HCH transport system substrate-binding protein
MNADAPPPEQQAVPPGAPPPAPSSAPSTAAPAPIANLELKAVLLLAFVSALIVAFIAYVMVARGFFEKTQTLVLLADDSEGILVGMDLTFSGFPVGRVSRIDLDANGKVRIIINVASKDAKWLRTSSIFTMEKGVVGDTKIRAFSGVLSDPPLPPGAERTVLRGDSSSEIPRLMATARQLLENVERITAADSSLNGSFNNLQSITGNLGSSMAGKYGVLGTLLGGDANAQRVVAALDQTNALLAKADQRVFGDKGVLNDTQASIQQLNALLLEARGTLKKVDAVLVEAQAATVEYKGVAVQAQGVASEARAVVSNVRVATTDLGLLRTEVDASLRKINSLVDEINRKWPFARETQIKLP